MRPLRRLITSLLLGALTTIAIAWSLAIGLRDRGLTRRIYRIDPLQEAQPYVSLSITDYRRPYMYRRVWAADYPHLMNSWPTLKLLDQNASAIDTLTGLSSSTRIPAPCPTPRPDLSKEEWQGLQDARGWPRLALYCDMYWIVPETAAGCQLRVKGGIRISGGPVALRSLSHVRALPLRPLWPGFLYNSALFAAGWFSLLTVPILIRRLRQRRHHCSKCRYDLRGAPGPACPECGFAFQPAAPATEPSHV